MSRVLYFVLTFLESGLAVFGIRSTLEQPPYRVVAELGRSVEIRSYGPLVAVETVAQGDNDAFSRLFRYITGANTGDRTIAMTAPVEQSGDFSAALGRGRTGESPLTMRFYLPKALAADPPPPKDPKVRIVTVPARTVGVIRFSGSLDRANLDALLATLKQVLAQTGHRTKGAPFFLGYDPPFTIPALRRNEIAIDIEP